MKHRSQQKFQLWLKDKFCFVFIQLRQLLRPYSGYESTAVLWAEEKLWVQPQVHVGNVCIPCKLRQRERGVVLQTLQHSYKRRASLRTGSRG